MQASTISASTVPAPLQVYGKKGSTLLRLKAEKTGTPVIVRPKVAPRIVVPRDV
jgi:hypothetical protein